MTGVKSGSLLDYAGRKEIYRTSKGGGSKAVQSFSPAWTVGSHRGRWATKESALVPLPCVSRV